MKEFTEKERRIPVAGEYDVLVCGGGTAGIPAAIAAARSGAKVCLLERNGYLGGVPAANINPTWHGKNRVQSGLLDEFIEGIRELGNVPTPAGGFQVDGESIKYWAQETALEAGVDILFYNTFSDVIMDGDRIEGVITEGISGRRAFLANTVIDAACGMVAYKAGAECMEGAPDGKIQGMSLRVRYGNVNFDRYFDWIEEHPKHFPKVSSESLENMKKLNAEGRDFHIPGNLVGLFKKHPEISNLPFESYFNCSKLFPNELNCNCTRIDGLDPNIGENVSRAEIACRRQAFALFELLRKHVPGFENCKLIETAPEIGIRESRCVVGDYVLSKADCEATTVFPDSICVNEWIHFDLHDPQYYSCQPTDGPVQIPYRCLLPKGIDGMLVAGRAASADHIANSGIRQMRTVFILGQVAGLAAALAARRGIPPRDVAYEDLRKMMDEHRIAYK